MRQLWRLRRLRTGLLAALVAVLLALLPWHPLARAADRGSSDQPLRLQLRWLPQAQFAGAYVAKELDLFAEQGIAVTLQPGGPDIDPLDRLLQGETDVAIGWTSDALRRRQNGADLVNVAQLLQRAGTTLVCREDAGIRRAADVRGKRIGTWFLGDQFDVGHWLSQQGLSLADVRLVAQRPHAADLLEGKVDCATAMSYNEFLTILRSGSLKSDLFTVRFGDRSDGFLEDGLYVRGADLRDPAKRQRLVGLLRALAAGWRYAARYPEEAVAITQRYMPSRDVEHQSGMLREMLMLMDLERGFGLLDPGDFNRSVEIVGSGSGDPAGIRRAAQGAWSLQVWRAAAIDGPQKGPLGPAGRHTFAQLVGSPWFYALDLVGTVAFGFSGFLRALQRRYDLWGCFILTLLPAVGGGTLRDLLIGGMRSPPFIFKDPTYLLLVALVIAAGSLFSKLLSAGAPETPWFSRLLSTCDSIGLATFTIIGCRVALEADLGWWWMAICAALTCAGGGMLLDVVTGREPRTFQGEPYEEIAVVGSLVLIAGLLIADRFETLTWPVLAALVVAWWFVFVARVLVVKLNLRSWRPGQRAQAGPEAAATLDQTAHS
jgi:NitT/TauT family transport system substrate-binding protein